MRVRRRSKRALYIGLGIFVAMFLFSFLVQKFKTSIGVDAVSMAGFDPGYIISDYQMSNYNSMNEGQIQDFLKVKNSCNDTDIDRYTGGQKVDYFSEMSPPVTWHVKDGHFVCMADEVFDGGTAAHIIYQAAQDYQINPQVLLVLLEKEQSLVRDTFPHSLQYRSATGYGCPDTAACSSKYYGLNNQVRNAAALFRTVLNGGWTNYPLGDNYIQYNPNASCGGSVVNVRNLATSALYRYTPYQPNAATLGGWNDGCNAYGNMNFYKLFEDWFGGINGEGYIPMGRPRYMKMATEADRINPLTLERVDTLEKGRNIMFTSKTTTIDGEMCLRTEYNTNNNVNACVRFSDLVEFFGLDYEPMATPRFFLVPAGTMMINSLSGEMTETRVNQKLFFDTKSYWTGGLCLRPRQYTYNDSQLCLLYDSLVEVEKKVSSYEAMNIPRVMKLRWDTYYYDTDLGLKLGDVINEGESFVFTDKMYLDDGSLCLRTLEDSEREGNRCFLFDDLSETSGDVNEGYVGMGKARSLRVASNANFITTSGTYYKKNASKGLGFYFVDKTYIGEEMCLRTIEDRNDGIGRCIMFKQLEESDELNFETMGNPRSFKINAQSAFVDLIDMLVRPSGQVREAYFVDKTFIDGKMCLRTEDDAFSGNYLCYYYDYLEEK